MRYTDLDGLTATGTVWAPGPVANSVWVLEDGHCPRRPGGAVVVKLPKGDVTAAHEMEYELPVRTTDRYGMRWTHHAHDFYKRTEMYGADEYRNAPKLSNKVWNACVEQDVEQYELIV